MEQMKQMKIQKKNNLVSEPTIAAISFQGRTITALVNKRKRKRKRKQNEKKRKFTDRSDYLRLAVVEELAAHHPMGY